MSARRITRPTPWSPLPIVTRRDEGPFRRGRLTVTLGGTGGADAAVDGPSGDIVTATATLDEREAASSAEHFDVLIVGAGISGVGAAYHLREQCPERTYVVLE